MEISKDNKILGAELAAVLEVEHNYRKQGYTVKRDYVFDGKMVDLYAEKGDNKFIFEFKARPFTHLEKKILNALELEQKSKVFILEL